MQHAIMKVPLTFHVEALPHKQLMVAGLVEEGRQPGLIPDPAVRLPLYQLLISGDHRHPWQDSQLGLDLRPCCLTIQKQVEYGYPNGLMVL